MSDEEKNSQDLPVEPESASQATDQNDLEAQCVQYREGWKRALADYENLKKTLYQAKDEDRKSVRADLAEMLLPVIDNFGYVTKHIPDVANCSDDFKKQFDPWVQGITHIERQFLEVMKSLGVEPIESVGTMFDPNLHESGGSKQVEGKKEHEIVEELIKGWKMGEKVIRPAKVIVNE